MLPELCDTAVRELGMKPPEFWRLTYAEFNAMADGKINDARRREKEMLSLAWHTAALTRTERLPPLAELLRDRKEQDVDDMISIAQAWTAALGGEVVVHGEEADNQN